MSDRNVSVITISREYGAFGRTIAQKVAGLLSLPLYGRDEIIKKVAKESGYSEDDIRKESEQMSRGARWMNAFLNNAAVYSSSYDEIFKAQREVILELAQSPCIILGRCGGHLLREEGIPGFHVFLFADRKTRLARASQLPENQGHTGKDLERLVNKREEGRENYYRQYTGCSMGDARNYHLSLDTGRIPADVCAQMIVTAVRAKTGAESEQR